MVSMTKPFVWLGGAFYSLMGGPSSQALVPFPRRFKKEGTPSSEYLIYPQQLQRHELTGKYAHTAP